MKYNQPWGVSDPNASYINGDVTVGRRGSIPPAESIEFPQRELVGLIQASTQSPTNADLTQLTKAIGLIDTHNSMKFATNGGSASQWSASCTGVLPFFTPPVGTSVWFKPGFASVNGGTVFSVNGGAFKSVVNGDLTPIAIGDIVSTAWVRLFFDGTYWQITSGSTRQTGALPLLHATANWYVNDTTGDDNNYDGTAATASGSHGPFRTIQRAADETLKYNMNGYDQYIWVANGGYSPVTLRQTNGTGWVWLMGNQGAPDQVSIATSAAMTIAIFQVAGAYNIRGFRLSATGGQPASGFFSNGGKTTIANCRFGPASEFHIGAAWNSQVVVDQGTITIEAGANARAHMGCSGGAQIVYNSVQYATLNVMGAVNFSAGFALAWQLAAVQMIYSSILGGGNVTGPQYNAMSNGVVSSLGVGSFPGNAAGILSYGGQYVP